MEDLRERLQRGLGDAYVIDSEIAGGGMSRLFLATETSLSRRVVVKVLPPEAVGPASQERFELELASTARLQHPHIVPVLRSGTADGLAWYVMPYLEGESLNRRIEREGALPVADGLRLIGEIADALDHAHRAGLVHRDVKPGNILLHDGHAYLTDFGIARALARDSDGSRLTTTGLAVGTLGYMAPEQFGGGPVDARADIYSLGAVAWETLTGRSALAGRAGSALLPSGRVSRATSIRSAIPATVSAALQRALAMDPADRFATAAEFRDALASAPRRRRDAAVIALSVAAATLLLFVAASSAVRSRRGESGVFPTRAADLIAIAPFEILRPDLDLWREGMVDILARNLDGMGPLRSLQPSLVIPRWKGRPDIASAQDLGRAVGAGLVVIGTVQGSGPDSISAHVTLVDVSRARVIAELRRKGDPQRMDAFTDSITFDLLRALGRERPIAAVRTRAIGAQSLTALKAFLQGEQLRRHGMFDSSAVLYEEAIRLDSTFSLAYHGLVMALKWAAVDSETRSRAIAAAFRAAQDLSGMSRYDSLGIVADTLQIIVQQATPESRRLDDYAIAAVARQWDAVLRQLAREYPSDPKALSELADLYFHQGWRFGVRLDSVTTLLVRAVDADSGFAEAYLHLIQMQVLMSQDVHAAASAIEALHRRDPGSLWAGTYRAALAVERDAVAAPATLLAAAERSNPIELRGLVSLLALSRRRTLLDTLWAPCVAGRLSSNCRMQLGFAWRMGGRDRLADQVDTGSTGHLWLRHAAGMVSADSLRAVFDALPARLPAPQLLLLAAELRDTVRLEHAARLVLDAPGERPLTNERAWRARIDGVRRLARGDTTGALELLESVPLGSGSVGLLAPLIADALSAAGREREAMALAESCLTTGPFILPFMQLRIARLADRLGDGAKARRTWQWVAEWTRRADPEYAPIRREAAEALARLAGAAGVDEATSAPTSRWSRSR
jgi:eukaryotic-like serine/threonine-protein kinase